MKVHVSRNARANIDDIFWTIAADNPAAARTWLQQLDAVLGRIALHPLSGRRVPEYAIEELREALHGNYRVLYFVAESKLVVICVLHGARKLRVRKQIHAALSDE